MSIDSQTELLLAVRLVVAAVLGAVIGFERERRGRSAGIRTFAAVALGSCAFTLISFIVTPTGNETTRIAAQIVTGVGFLGAGVILHDQGQTHISGLTTSATMWSAGAVGMAVGFGLYILAVVTTALLLLLLMLRHFPGLERHSIPNGRDQIDNG